MKIVIIVCHFDLILIDRFFIDRYFSSEIFQTILYDQFHNTTNVLHYHVSQSASSHIFEHLHKLITREHFFCRFSQRINLARRFLVNIFSISSRVDHIKSAENVFFNARSFSWCDVQLFLFFFNVMSKFFCFIIQFVCLFCNMIQFQAL
jgi:hypothetical protein